MTKRIFTLKEYSPPDAPVGARSSCSQIYLTLFEQEFQLFVGYYYNDWGDREEKSTRYRGTYQENKTEICCVSQEIETVDRFWDHEMQQGHHHHNKKTIQETFIFLKEGEGKIVCSINYGGFQGKQMSTQIEPHPPIF